MHKLDKKTGKREILDLKTKKAANLYLEYRDKQKKGEFAPSKSKDALHMALGEKPEQRGRVKGVGGINVGTKMVFVEEQRRGRKRVSSSEDREELKNELREELREEFKASLKEVRASLIEEMGIMSNQNSNSIGVHLSPSIQAPDVSTPTSEPLKEAAIPLHHDNPQSEFEGNTRCHLLVLDPDTSSNVFDVAIGSLYQWNGKWNGMKWNGKINRKKPLWKFVKCAQQLGGLECGFYIMRYMLEVLKSCSGEKDLDKVYDSRREEPFINEEMNEIRDKWAAYFTNNCME